MNINNNVVNVLQTVTQTSPMHYFCDLVIILTHTSGLLVIRIHGNMSIYTIQMLLDWVVIDFFLFLFFQHLSFVRKLVGHLFSVESSWLHFGSLQKKLHVKVARIYIILPNL